MGSFAKDKLISLKKQPNVRFMPPSNVGIGFQCTQYTRCYKRKSESFTALEPHCGCKKANLNGRLSLRIILLVIPCDFGACFKS